MRKKLTGRGQLRKLASALGAALIVAVSTARLLAHDPGLSSLDVRVGDREVVAVLSLAASDARSVGNEDVMAALVRDSIVLMLDGRRLVPLTTRVSFDDSGGVHVQIRCERLPGFQLAVRSRIAQRLPRGHRELLSIGAENGAVLVERMLDQDSSETAVDVSAVAVSPRPPFARFFLLGVEHILTGYDHLLFLASVLVVIRRWRDVIQTVTAFTVAHSITLALATTGVLLISGRLTEPLIAASIVYVGFENLVRTPPASRWKVTFTFGLVHGLGFAGVLRDLGVGAARHGGIILPLASFNAGVEAGQMAVAAGVVPAFWWLSARSSPRFQFAGAWSLVVIAAGAYWFLERIV